MSKNVPTKLDKVVGNQAMDQVVIRDVFPLGSKGHNEITVRPTSDLITAYKDLGSLKDQSLLNRSGHLVIAFAAFVVLGFSIFVASRSSNTREIASLSEFKGFVSDRAPTRVEHYQYDKSCYKGDNGEQVCMTRTSRK